MEPRQKVSFHEATVIGFYQLGDLLKLEVEDALIGNATSPVTVQVSQLTSLTVDGEPASALMETDDGEILTLELENGKVFVIIEWNDFPNGNSFTRAYRIAGQSVSILQDEKVVFQY